jgi:hypothetical protein
MRAIVRSIDASPDLPLSAITTESKYDAELLDWRQ